MDLPKLGRKHFLARRSSRRRAGCSLVKVTARNLAPMISSVRVNVIIRLFDINFDVHIVSSLSVPCSHTSG